MIRVMSSNAPHSTECFNTEHQKQMEVMMEPHNPTHARRKRSRREEDTNQDLEHFKRLRIADDSLQQKEKLDDAKRIENRELRIIIPKGLNLSEDAFRLAVTTDYPDTILGRLLSSTQEEETTNMAESKGKELVLYQPTKLTEILKMATHQVEHQMDLD